MKFVDLHLFTNCTLYFLKNSVFNKCNFLKSKKTSSCTLVETILITGIDVNTKKKQM